MSGFGKRNRPREPVGFRASAPAAMLPAADGWRSPPSGSFAFDAPSMRTGDRSMVMAYLLWLFLGNLGAHRLYVGKTGSGLVLASLTLAGWLLTLVYLIGLVIVIPVLLFVLIDAFRIPGWVRGY